MSSTAKVQVRYFASIREALGSGERLQTQTPCTVADARDALIARSPAHAAALARGRAVRVAVNQTLSDETAVVNDGDELAFFPPVTGG
jgi:molybdopterin synthase sulfur carrier subunit